LCYTGIDVEQDHGFAGGISHILGYSRWPFRAILRSLEHLERKSMSIGMLREQDLLRHITKEHGSSIAATCQKWLGS